MNKLPDNASDREKIDFVMSVVRKIYDNNGFGYWVYSDNTLISINYWGEGLSVKIHPDKVSITNDYQGEERLYDEINEILKNYKFAKCERIASENLYSDPDTGEILNLGYIYNYKCYAELPIENRVDSEYLDKVNIDLIDMMEEITNIYGFFNNYYLQNSRSEDEDSEE